MSRFHQGPSGRPVQCNATKRACPVGGSHWDSVEEAAQAIMRRDVRPQSVDLLDGFDDMPDLSRTPAVAWAEDQADRLGVAPDKLQKAYAVMVDGEGWDEHRLWQAMKWLMERGYPLGQKNVVKADAHLETQSAQAAARRGLRARSHQEGGVGRLRRDFGL